MYGKFLRPTLLILGLTLAFATLPGYALVTPGVDAGAAFVVNDPREITFVDLEKIIEYTKARLLEDKTVVDQDVMDFWEAFRKNGAPYAGTSGNRAKIAMVVPGGSSPANAGVIAVSGNIDKKAVLELISRHYSEHIQEHMTDEQKAEHGIGKMGSPIGNYPSHLFVLPRRNREVHIVDLGGVILVGSHKAGDTKLLQEVINVLTGKTPMKKGWNRSSKVTFRFEPTADERDRLVRDIEDAYVRYSTGRMNYRRGIARFKERLRNIVVAKKVRQVEGFVADMESAALVVDRVFDGSTDSKNLCLTLTFRSAETAKMVKAGIMKHLVAEVKRPVNKGFQAALENPTVTVEDRSVILHVPLESEEDQMYAFAVMATYAARGIIGTRGTSIVRKLRVISDLEAKAGRALNDSINVELARSSFFNIGRKFSLMYSNLKVKANVRNCEDVYAGITDNPKVLKNSVEKLVKATTRNFDDLDKLLTMREADYAKKDKKELAMIRDIFQLRALRLEMSTNARMLIQAVQSAEYRKAAGPIESKLQENLGLLWAKSGMGLSKPAAASAQLPLAFQNTGAKPAEPVAIPEGMTLEQAFNDYQAALKTYSEASAKGDAAAMKALYDDFDLKTRIYHALLEKREKGN